MNAATLRDKLRTSRARGGCTSGPKESELDASNPMPPTRDSDGMIQQLDRGILMLRHTGADDVNARYHAALQHFEALRQQLVAEMQGDSLA